MAEGLQSLFHHEPAQSSSHLVRYNHGVAGILDRPDVAAHPDLLTVQFRQGVGYPVFPGSAHSPYSVSDTISIPILDFPSVREFEQGIAAGLWMSGQSQEIGSWEHLPDRWDHIFDGYTRPKLVVGHPQTLSEIVMAALRMGGGSSPNFSVVSPSAEPWRYAQYLGAETFPCHDFPKGVLAFVADGCTLGQIYMRQAPMEKEWPMTYNPVRAGVLYNASAIRVLKLFVPKARSDAWALVSSDDFLAD